MEQRLYRSNSSRMIAGVCGGIGEYLRLDPVIVRVFFVLLAFAKGIGLIAYLVAWVLVPRRAPGETPSVDTPPASWHRYLPGLILIAVGALLLIREHFWWFSFSDLWPAVLVLGGLALVYRGFRAHQRRMVEQACPGTNGGSNGGGLS